MEIKNWLEIETMAAKLEDHKKLGRNIFRATCPHCAKYIYGHFDDDLIAKLPKICPECHERVGIEVKF